MGTGEITNSDRIKAAISAAKGGSVGELEAALRPLALHFGVMPEGLDSAIDGMRGGETQSAKKAACAQAIKILERELARVGASVDKPNPEAVVPEQDPVASGDEPKPAG